MQATEMDRSPGLPSLMVTTRRRLMPQGNLMLVLAGRDAGVAFDAALGITEELHTCHCFVSLTRVRYGTGWPWFPACWSPSRSRRSGPCWWIRQGRRDPRPSGYLLRRSSPWKWPPKWNGMKATPGADPFGDHRHDLDLAAFRPVDPDHLPVLMPTLLASRGLISTNMSCCSSASHGLDRVSSPPPSYSTRRPEVRMIGKSLEKSFFWIEA